MVYIRKMLASAENLCFNYGCRRLHDDLTNMPASRRPRMKSFSSRGARGLHTIGFQHGHAVHFIISKGDTMKSLLVILAGALTTALVLFGAALAADPAKPADAPKAETPALIVIDSAGKEQKVKDWKITTGTRHLSWLAGPAPVADKEAPRKVEKPGAKVGPEALLLRENNSTTYEEGVLTLVPLDRIRAIDYDDMDTVTVTVAGDKPEADEKLQGPTKYKGINKLAIEAEVDKGALGRAELTFQGGVSKGIKGIRFPTPKSAAAPTGRAASVMLTDKKQTEPHKVTDLQALYRFGDGSEVVSPNLKFRKTLTINIADVKKLRAAGGNGTEFGVTDKDGAEEIYTLLNPAPLEINRAAVLEGFLGKVPAGYKLFPVAIVA